MKSRVKFTYQDYLLWPLEERRYELIEGEFYMVPSPNVYHQDISGRLELILRQFVKEHNLGMVYDAPLDVVLSERNVVQPDILFITKERRGIITEKHIRGAPDLVVEILSPETREKDFAIKKGLYGKYGVREFWVVDPEAKTVEVLVWAEEGMETLKVFPLDSALRSPLLPKLAIELKEIF